MAGLRTHADRGSTLTFRLFLAALCTVIAGAVGLAVTEPPTPTPSAIVVSAPAASSSPTLHLSPSPSAAVNSQLNRSAKDTAKHTKRTTKPRKSTKAAKPTPPPVRRSDIAVAIYNNTRITGLAAATSGRARAAGWSVLDVGNWRGSIPASTVYYPVSRQAQAVLLARDLGIPRVRPAIATMRTDRLTVVLNGG